MLSSSIMLNDISSSLITSNVIISFFVLISLSIFIYKQINFMNSFDISCILSKRDFNLISYWINPKIKHSFTLLYKTSRDGDLSKDFHDHCDDIRPSLTIISTTEGWIFGGYSDMKWISTSIPTYIESKNIFLFSLNLKKKYPPREKFGVIYNLSSKGPSFGYGNDISISDQCLVMESKCYSPVSFGNLQKRNEFNGGNERFIVKELEVFKVDNGLI